MTQSGQENITPGVCSLQAPSLGCMTGRELHPWVLAAPPAWGEDRRPSMRLPPAFSKVGLYLCLFSDSSN